MEIVVIGVVGIAVVVLSTTLAPRIGIAAPLILTLVGIGVGFLPFVQAIEIKPEWVLGGLLPPLLYAVAVNTPVMEFRRDFSVISAYSVVLVVVSSVVVGLVMTWLVPGMPLAVGIAVGAIVSPTDAVATSIVRKAGVSPRIVTVLEGESMLNDASALVVLRSALAAVAVTVSLGKVAEDFAYAVLVAVLIGLVVGRINLIVRAHISVATSNIAFSLAVPFMAYLPAEAAGASGLVAVVTAGIVAGQGMPKRLDAQVRLAERAVWQTIELLAESAVFLLMGLQTFGLVEAVLSGGDSLWFAFGAGALVAAIVVFVRAVFVTGSVWSLARQFRRQTARADALRARMRTAEGQQRMKALRERASDRPAEQANRFRDMVQRRRADLEYLANERFGWREGILLVWAGMRGAVTLAAAQSLPSTVPHRALLVLVAFTVAVGTLLVQGATLSPLVRKLGLIRNDDEEDAIKLRALLAELSATATARLDDPGLARADGTPYPAEIIDDARHEVTLSRELDDETTQDSATQLELRLDLVERQREKLLHLRGLGTYPSAVLDHALDLLDADEIGIELRKR